MSAASLSSLGSRVAEPPDAVQRRQRRAYQAGELAWRDNRIPLRLVPLYETLVRYVGANAFTWVKVDTLAAEFGVHLATMKRWLATLEDAALIRRQRQFARSSRTFITAYESETKPWHLTTQQATTAGIDACSAVDCTAGLEATTTADTTPWSTEIRIDDPADRGAHLGSEDVPPLHERTGDADDTRPAADTVGRISALSLSAKLRPDHLKHSHLTGGGGTLLPSRKSQIAGPIPHTSAVAALRAMGTCDPGCLAELAHRPFDEIRAACMLAHRVPHPEDLGALAVHFARQLRDGLLAWPPPAPARLPGGHAKARAGQAAEHDDRLIVCARCQVRVVGSAGTRCLACAVQPVAQAVSGSPISPAAEPRGSAAPGEPLACRLMDHEADRAAVWQRVCATLIAETAITDVALWLDGTALLEVTDTTAVLGVSNVFVRDELQQRYAPALEASLGAAFGRTISLTVVVDGVGADDHDPVARVSAG